MRRYAGCTTTLSRTPSWRVDVEQEGRGIFPLRHHVRHSPDGFAWGYGGSGPAELARCLLIDALDAHGWETKTAYPPYEEMDDLVTPSLYQDFKDAFVARWPTDENWTLTRGEILDWILDRDRTKMSLAAIRALDLREATE